MSLPPDPLALVLSGGGARAAYQAGVLRGLAQLAPELELPILTGTSAGAINAAFLAARPASFEQASRGLEQLWLELEPEEVFRVDSSSLLRNVLRWGLRLVMGGRKAGMRVHGLVDTAPLGTTLARALNAQAGRIPGIESNLASGRLHALAITTSSYSTGQSVTWVQARAFEGWRRAQRRSRPGEIGLEHVLASSALPLFFAAVKVEDEWFGDGGIRQTAPLSPAVHLGAERILAISTRYARSVQEAETPSVDDYPPPAQVIGALFNAVFLDLLDADAMRLEYMNRMLRLLPAEHRGSLRPVRLLTLRPSQDLGRLANSYEARLPRGLRFLTRGLGTRETRSNDMLSLIMFQPDYLRALVELGERDALARADEIRAFLAPRDTHAALPWPAGGAELGPEVV